MYSTTVHVHVFRSHIFVLSYLRTCLHVARMGFLCSVFLYQILVQYTYSTRTVHDYTYSTCTCTRRGLCSCVVCTVYTYTYSRTVHVRSLTTLWKYGNIFVALLSKVRVSIFERKYNVVPSRYESTTYFRKYTYCTRVALHVFI